MKSFSITDIGQKRQINQDYLYCNENAVGSFPNLFIVADGMGGHRAGDYASRLCVTKVVDLIASSELTTPVSVFDDAIGYANRVVYGEAGANEEYEGMGTTLVASVIIDGTLYVANIGDSRLYLLRDRLQQITEDHSLVEEMVKNGEIDKEEARSHPNKNIITRALGTSATVVPDYFELEVNEGDIILMCSDGLTNMIEDDEIASIIWQHPKDLPEAGRQLVQKANEYGGKDNIAIVLVQI